jgi:hypothetical protein
VSALNAALYEDEEAYWQAITRLIEDPTRRRPTPQAVRDVGSVVIEDIFEVAGWTKLLKRYGADIAETASIGYMLIANEDWQELDRDRAVKLMDESLRAAQTTRAALGTPQISLDNVDNRLTVMTMGLASGAPEGAPLRDYVVSQPPYQRVDDHGSLLMKMGEAMAGPKRRHVEAFRQGQTYAWKTGLGLGVLDVMGQVPHHDRWGEPA